MKARENETNKQNTDTKNLIDAINEIENAMVRWHLARDNDDETLEEINKILVSIGRLRWFNSNDRKTDVSIRSEQLVCEYCNEDAKPTCCDICLERMVNAVQKEN